MQLPPVPTVTAPFSLADHWREIALFCIGNWAITGLLVRAVADGWFMAAFDRCKDRITNRLDEWYRERHVRVDSAVARVDVHEDRLEGFEESLLQQGRALSEKLGEHFTANTRAMENVTAALGAIQQEAAETAKAVARIEGRMEGGVWDGVNRRRRSRRKSPET